MRKTLCLVFLGCALVVGLACSGDGDSATPTAPAATGLESVTGAAAAKIFLCHGIEDEYPYGVVVSVKTPTDNRHSLHLDSDRDCRCPSSSIPGQSCLVFQDPYNNPYCAIPCPSTN